MRLIRGKIGQRVQFAVDVLVEPKKRAIFVYDIKTAKLDCALSSKGNRSNPYFDALRMLRQ